ncbi:hypothetical protein Taro_004180 [Colocasia esculenta]|uniref:Uncharacterized protein n=1 Tax=Colocasia esculenta TaxID=4460 RepID=A0A843TQV5_COLES|nr:hypothetical protein [Colocasia esculenta]
MQSRPVTAIGRRVQLDARSHPQRLPRLRESLAERTRRAAQSQRSEVVFNSTRDLIPRSWIWVPEHRRYSHPLRFIPTPLVNELGITFRTGIGIAYVTTIRNRHSETVDKAILFRGQNSPRSVCTSTPTVVPSGRTQIFIRSGVGTAHEAPIQHRHFDPVGKWSHSEIYGPATKFLSGSAVAGCRCDRIRTSLRSNRQIFSLGYQNRL